MSIGPSSVPKLRIGGASPDETDMVWPANYSWHDHDDGWMGGETPRVSVPVVVNVESGRVHLAITARARPDILRADIYRPVRNPARVPRRAVKVDFNDGELNAHVRSTARSQHLSFDAPGPRTPYIRLTVGYTGLGESKENWAHYYLSTRKTRFFRG